ncbi:hypothetical protein [Paracoccus siganidrum]|uniref:Flagellar biosynthesis protein FlgL n=1 Tax=Paracoccus siganidrum TaxID=1276757 RepID=A0A419A8F3_9RHOB|nr:hypothetical protein [Paracoccus siganidrum]RJL18335.1 hypothetical protein D3P05_07435 [Paracoccus siganidrum]RMC31499.1 hypothetical protein C9E82_15805 [Paracoccus siganidrum]
MSIYSVGDQARALALQSAAGRLKTTLNVLTEELASGEVSDIGQRVLGNTQSLRAIEDKISVAEEFHRISVEADGLAKMMGAALDSIQSVSSNIAINLINEPVGESASLLLERSGQVAKNLDLIVTRLNTSFGSYHVFSGTATDQPPLMSGPEILDIIQGMISGLTIASDIVQAVSDWFDSPSGSGGFLDIAYRGNDDGRQFMVSEGRVVVLDVNAGAPEIRDTLKGMAISSLVSRGVLSTDVSQQRELMRLGGGIIYDSDPLLISAQAKIGHFAQSIERNIAENSTLSDSLKISRNDIRSANPYETSLALSDVESRLQALYAVTNRLSKLKLVDYVR